MKIEKHNSLVHATKVLALVKEALKGLKGRNPTLEVWANGREQGYALRQYQIDVSRMVVFAESRGSEQIVVISGSVFQFDHSSNQPSDELWASKSARRHFSSDLEAAKHIAACFVAPFKAAKKIKKVK